MKCSTVRNQLAGYLDYGVATAERAQERVQVREHLNACAPCREELERFRKLAVMLSRVPKAQPPADLAVRIKVAAAQAQPTETWSGRYQRLKDRAELLLDNVFRPLTVPATGGFFSAFVVFALVFQMIVPGITVRAVENDVPINLMQPAELLSLSDYPQTWSTERQGIDLALPHGLMIDVTVDAQGQMVGYQVLSGPNTAELRHELDQMLLFSRFRPMMSFGRARSGGHVILSFSAVHVHG
jgi:hypothetical protein